MKKQFFFLFLFFLYLTSCSTDKVSDKVASDIENLPRQKASISTQYGDMIIELFNETPKHRDNFLKLAKEGFYYKKPSKEKDYCCSREKKEDSGSNRKSSNPIEDLL